MSDGLRDLLFVMRQHPSFKELLSFVDAPAVEPFHMGAPDTQTMRWVYRSGMQAQHSRWLEYLVDYNPPQNGFGPRK